MTLKSLITGPETPTARVARALARLGTATPPDISRDTGMARSTISSALSELREAGLVQSLDLQSSPMGRPSLRHTLNPAAGHCAGVLLGFDEVRLMICDVAHQVIVERSLPMRRGYTPDDALGPLKTALQEECSAIGIVHTDLLGIGFAVAAPTSASGVARQSSGLAGWQEVAVGEVCGPVLGCTIHAANESSCGALAEMMWGAAQGETDLIFLKCSLGIGGAVVTDGQVRIGHNGYAGEFGHMQVITDGPLCRCGRRGCLDTLASGAKLMRLAAEAEGAPVALTDLVAAARSGHAGYTRLLEDAAEHFGTTLAMMTAAMNPALYVIAGEMAAAGDLFLDRIRQTHDRLAAVPSTAPDGPRFVLSQFPNNDTVMGAAGLTLRQEKIVWRQG